MTLTGYFTRAFAGRFVAVLLGFGALLQLLDLFDKAGMVLERGQGGTDLLTYLVLRLPLVLNQLVPLAVLIGAVTAFMAFAQHNEIVALRSAGASSWRLLRSLLPAVAVIAILHALLMDQVVPRAEQALQDWWTARPVPGAKAGSPVRTLWLRSGSSIVSVMKMFDQGRRLEGVIIVRRNGQGQATARIVAREALWQAGRWTLRDVNALTLADGGQKTMHWETGPWPDGPPPENIAFVANPTQFLSVCRLLTLIKGTWSGTRDRAYYQVQVQKIVSTPVSSFIMLLLAQPALHGIRRSQIFGLGMATGLGLGLLFLVFQGLLSALAEAGILPAMLAVWFPPVIFACIGGSILLYLEE